MELQIKKIQTLYQLQKLYLVSSFRYIIVCAFDFTRVFLLCVFTFCDPINTKNSRRETGAERTPKENGTINFLVNYCVVSRHKVNCMPKVTHVCKARQYFFVLFGVLITNIKTFHNSKAPFAPQKFFELNDTRTTHWC